MSPTLVPCGYSELTIAGYRSATLRVPEYMSPNPDIKEGVLLRNVSAAPICNHFAVVPPSSRIREPVPFLV